MSEIEVIAFDKGINRRKSRLFLGEGELHDCSGFNLNISGDLSCRDPVSELYDIDTSGTINGFHRYGDSLITSSKSYCPGSQAYFNYIYQRDVDDTSWTNISFMSNNVRPTFLSYEKFIFAVDGESKKVFVDEKPYEWGVPNPVAGPGVVTGAAGSPDGEYDCYYTFYVIFPNGKAVETGPSPVSTVDATGGLVIEWTNIPTCPYEGDDLIIHRRLYRTVSGDIYLLDTIYDNATETYSDDTADATLQLNAIMDCDDYDVPPDGMTDIVMHLQRVYGIKENKLHFSEAYMPFVFSTGNDITVAKENETLLKIVSWGNQMYIASTEKWRRIPGSDPDTWEVRDTYSEVGIINRATVKPTSFGILGLWYDGIYLFNGSTTKNITETVLGREFFNSISDWTSAYAEFIDNIYYLYYETTSGIDTCLKIDLAYYPEIRCYYSDFTPSAHLYCPGGGINYYAYDGTEYEESGTEDITTTLTSRDMVFGNVFKKKNLEYLFYDIDTSGENVTVNIYVDDVSSHTVTLNTSSRTRKRSYLLPNLEGYKFSIVITCADSSDLHIYGPWGLSATLVGD